MHFIRKLINLKNKTMKIRNFLFAIIGIAFLLSSCGQNMNTNVTIKTDLDTISYMLGVDIGNSLIVNDFTDVEVDVFVNGLMDAINKEELKVEEEKIKPYIQKFFTELREKKMQKNLDEGREFLEKNKKRDEVIETESGLQYEIITEGTGKSPSATDIVVCRYHGTLIDGTVFDSSFERGDTAEIPLNRVVPGWTEGFQLMKEGGKAKLYLPTEIAYGQRPRPGGKIEANMAIIFEVELIEVKEGQEQPSSER